MSKCERGNNHKNLNIKKIVNKVGSINLYFQNVRSLKKDIESINIALSSDFYHILIFVETWLDSTVINSEFCNNYEIYRRDRNLRGGGIIIAILPGLRSELFYVSVIMELICLVLYVDKVKLFLVAVYIPPPCVKESLDTLEYELDKIFNSMSSYDLIIIIGDFNVPCVKFDADLNNDKLSNQLISYFFTNSLNQYIDFPTRNLNFLDLAFSNVYLKVTEDIPIIVSDHKAVNISLDYQPNEVIKNNNLKFYNYKLTDYTKLNEYLLNVDWELLMNSDNVEDLYNIFYKTYIEALKSFTPLVKVKTNARKCKPWIDRNIVYVNKLKNSLHSIWLESKSTFDQSLYKTTRSYYKLIYNSSKTLFFHNIQDNLASGNSDPFWRYIKSNNNKRKPPEQMHYNSKTVCNDNEVADLFLEFFTEQFNNKVYPIPEIVKVNPDVISIPCISESDVVSAAKLIKSKSFVTPDGIPMLPITNTIYSIAAPLSMLFNKCIETGHYPSNLKYSLVLPTFKKGAMDEIINYRPISILSNFSKIFEKIITFYLSHSLMPFISPNQHGFLGKRSTVSNLSVFMREISLAFDKRSQMDVYFSDFSKAFDSINHSLLLHKLNLFNLSSNTINLITSFFNNRSQKVLYNNTYSKSSIITSGVIQGSILGPFLFTLYINDLPSYVDSHILMFADDVKIFSEILSVKDSFYFQKNVSKLECWSNTWGLSINTQKSAIMSFSRKSNTIIYDYKMKGLMINRVQTFRDLGVTFSSDLRFNLHCEIIYREASKKIGYYKRICSSFKDLQTILSIYNIYIRSKLEYASSVWNCTTLQNSNLLEALQYRFLRFIAYHLKIDYSNFNYEQLCDMFNVDKLKTRRLKTDLIYLYKIINGYVDNPHLSNTVVKHAANRNLRKNPIFVCNYTKNEYCNLDVIFRATKFCNENNLSTYSSFSVFKRNLNLILHSS